MSAWCLDERVAGLRCEGGWFGFACSLVGLGWVGLTQKDLLFGNEGGKEGFVGVLRIWSVKIYVG